jgi:hypothetical protein
MMSLTEENCHSELKAIPPVGLFDPEKESVNKLIGKRVTGEIVALYVNPDRFYVDVPGVPGDCLVEYRNLGVKDKTKEFKRARVEGLASGRLRKGNRGFYLEHVVIKGENDE